MAQKMVVLGVTACIGAYKACSVVRGLQKAGIHVRVIMTEHATELIGPKTFEALTHEAVMVGMFDEDGKDPIPHITLAKEADLMIVAPCTANMLAKLATGVADDLLSTTALAMQSPLLVAPAANVHMYEDAATQQNINTLRKRGWTVLEGGEGYLACGDEGSGRLAEPDDIVAAALDMLKINPDMTGIKVLITAGPTREAIDPVRFITNYSSGKSGYALAEAARDRGAEVTLIAGPTQLDDPKGVNVVHVTSALDMFGACEKAFPSADIAIFSAAVSDARPKQAAGYKLKKGMDDTALTFIELVENPDILATLAAKKNGQVVIGYAAETNDVLVNARNKLSKKGADLIVANEVSPTQGFGTDSNKLWFVTEKAEEDIPAARKDKLANVVLDKALALLLEKRR